MKFYQNWTGSICDKSGTATTAEEFSARVPGNIQRDFAEYRGWLEDLQYSTNAKVLDEYRNSYWKYRTRLDYSAAPDERVFFVAEGIDY